MLSVTKPILQQWEKFVFVKKRKTFNREMRENLENFVFTKIFLKLVKFQENSEK